jgi:hypothetical protein
VPCLFKYFLEAFIFLKYTQWKCILSFDNSTAMYKDLKPYTLAGFEPGTCSGGGRADHSATTPGKLSVPWRSPLALSFQPFWNFFPTERLTKCRQIQSVPFRAINGRPFWLPSDHAWMWPRVNVTTRECDHAWMWPRVNVTTRECDHAWMWPRVNVTTCECDDAWMWPRVNVTTHDHAW